MLFVQGQLTTGEENSSTAPPGSLVRIPLLSPDIWFLFHTHVVTLHNKQMI